MQKKKKVGYKDSKNSMYHVLKYVKTIFKNTVLISGFYLSATLHLVQEQSTAAVLVCDWLWPAFQSQLGPLFLGSHVLLELQQTTNIKKCSRQTAWNIKRTNEC